MRRTLGLVLVIVLLTSGCFYIRETVTVVGTVSDATGPVSNALVTFVEAGISQLTDSDGSFVVVLEPGDYTITVSRFGYDTVTEQTRVQANQELEFVLSYDSHIEVGFAEEDLGPWTEMEGIRHFPYWTPEVVASPARSGRSIKLIANEPTGRYGGAFYYMLPEPVTEGKLAFSGWLYAEDNTHRSLMISVAQGTRIFSDPQDAVSLYLHNNGTIQYYAGGWYRLDANYEAQSWFQIKVVVDLDAQEYDIYVSDMTTKVATASLRAPQ